MSDLGSYVEQARKEKGWTRHELAMRMAEFQQAIAGADPDKLCPKMLYFANSLGGGLRKYISPDLVTTIAGALEVSEETIWKKIPDGQSNKKYIPLYRNGMSST